MSRSLLITCALVLSPLPALAEDAALPSVPAFAIPFDEIDEATLQAEVSRQASLFLRTVQSHWGHNRKALLGFVEGEIGQDEQGKLVYQRNLSDHGVLEGYEFRQDSLVRGRFVVLQRPLNGLNEFIGYYTSLKQKLTGLYGQPLQDRIVWENDLYQPVPGYWGVAVMIGYLHYHAVWETDDGTITLELTGDRRSKLSLEYDSGRTGADT